MSIALSKPTLWYDAGMPIDFDNSSQDTQLRIAREREEEDLANMLSSKYGLSYLDLGGLPIDNEALGLIPEAEAKEAEAIAFRKDGKTISVALRNPSNPALPKIFSKIEEAGYALDKYLVSTKSLSKGLALYSELGSSSAVARGQFDITAEELLRLEGSLKSVSALRALLLETVGGEGTGKISKLLEEILAGAVALKASDIHLEPSETGAKLRLRMDGLLTDICEFGPAPYRFISSRIKILAGLKLNVLNRAQDGRFSFSFGDRDIELRVSSIPDNYGESFVLRLLDSRTVNVSFDNLGLYPKLAKRLEMEIARPNGMLLTTGPTGSGKTTTLYAFLKKVHTPDIKIITIEDPVEYHLGGIVQTQANGKDYTFSTGLRAIVRQDPDIIMVGEIRDGETAEIAIQAALTGHFVISTLHTNSAAGTFPRMVDLGIDPKEFGSAVTVTMGQRLIRTLNPETKRMRKTTDEEKKLLERIFADVTDSELRPTSFEEIGEAVPQSAEDTGYKGRTGVREAIFMDDELATFLRDNPTASEIEKHTRRQGYLTMAQDGAWKALRGETTLEEVLRMVDIPREE